MGPDQQIRHTPDVFCRCGAESFELRDLDLNLNGNTNSCNTCGKDFKKSRRLRILQDKRRARAALLEECEQLPLSNHFLLVEELTNADIALEELEPIGVPPESLAGRILARGLQATVIARCSRRQYEALQLRNHNTTTRAAYQRYLLVRFGLPGPRTTRKIASSPIGL